MSSDSFGLSSDLFGFSSKGVLSSDVIGFLWIVVRFVLIFIARLRVIRCHQIPLDCRQIFLDFHQKALCHQAADFCPSAVIG